MVLFRAVDIGAELFAMTASVRAGAHAGEAGQREASTLADLFCREARLRIGQMFDRSTANDGEMYRASQQVMRGEHAWLEKGIVGLMSDEMPAPSGSKGGRATQELRRAEGVGVA